MTQAFKHAIVASQPRVAAVSNGTIFLLIMQLPHNKRFPEQLYKHAVFKTFSLLFFI